MHLRKDAKFQDDTAPFSGNPDFDDAVVEIESVLGANGERGSWKQACAAKRSIERYREQQHLKELLTDAYDEDDGGDFEATRLELETYLDDD